MQLEPNLALGSAKLFAYYFERNGETTEGFLVMESHDWTQAKL